MNLISANDQQACNARESTASRMLRNAAAALLLLISGAECGMAGLMLAGATTLPNIVFLLCTLGLFAAAVIQVRAPDNRVLMAVQSAAAASLLSLFWASGRAGHAGPSITMGRSIYDLTLTLAGLLFMAILLARLLRRDADPGACRCG